MIMMKLITISKHQKYKEFRNSYQILVVYNMYFPIQVSNQNTNKFFFNILNSSSSKIIINFYLFISFLLHSSKKKKKKRTIKILYFTCLRSCGKNIMKFDRTHWKILAFKTRKKIWIQGINFKWFFFKHMDNFHS